MSDKLVVYDLAPSPNNMKVHIALNYKELAWERVPVDLQDRSEVIKVSGQPLTPVLVRDGHVIFDSAAILRYLDANFRQTRRLYAEDRDTMRAIEEWELRSRTETAQPTRMVFGQAFAPQKDASVFQKATELLQSITARIEERLQSSDWLVGKDMTAADVTNAPWIYYGMLTEQAAAASDVHRMFATQLQLGQGRDRTRAWVDRVMRYDS